MNNFVQQLGAWGANETRLRFNVEHFYCERTE